MREPRRKHRSVPYYKVQVFDDHLQVWKDERKVFDTSDAAQNFIEEFIAPRLARIMVIERNTRYVLDE